MKKLITTITVIGGALILSACASTDGTKRIVLPLDHGPRAQTTPWENKQRLLRAEQEAKTRENADKAAQDPNNH